MRANALTKRPSDIPSTAFPTASATTTHTGPFTSSPSRPNATAAVTDAWTAATDANAIP